MPKLMPANEAKAAANAAIDKIVEDTLSSIAGTIAERSKIGRKHCEFTLSNGAMYFIDEIVKALSDLGYQVEYTTNSDIKIYWNKA